MSASGTRSPPPTRRAALPSVPCLPSQRNFLAPDGRRLGAGGHLPSAASNPAATPGGGRRSGAEGGAEQSAGVCHKEPSAPTRRSAGVDALPARPARYFLRKYHRPLRPLLHLVPDTDPRGAGTFGGRAGAAHWGRPARGSRSLRGCLLLVPRGGGRSSVHASLTQPTRTTAPTTRLPLHAPSLSLSLPTPSGP